MKTLLTSKTMIALAVAIAASAANIANAYEQPIPPPATDAGLPANIAPGSDLAQVFKLVQANVDLNVIKNFIANAANRFDLDAEKIIALFDAGVPSNVLDTMLEHDRQILIAAQTPPAAAPVAVTTVQTAPQPPVTVNYFYTSLSPYGNWVEVDGYGRCWRPTVCVYDNTWRPYCDRGHWVYSDCGWYWDSDYSWGATFHYGRWFQNPRYGWCWWPETTWAPSWVLWRSGEEHCGWAPLPPRCDFRREGGFFYNGSHVSVGFDFGLSASCFTFVSLNHFSDRHLRDHREDGRRTAQIFQSTTVVNNYNYGGANNTTIVNNGISVDRVSAATHHPVTVVAVNELPNATRHGWRGEDRNTRAPGGTANNADGQNRHTPGSPNNSANNANLHQPGSGAKNGNVGSPVIIDQNGQRGRGGAVKDSNTQARNQNGSPVVNNNNVSADAGHQSVRRMGAVSQTQNQNEPPAADNNRAQRAARLEQQQRAQWQQNQTATPSVVTTPPQRSAIQVEQPQIIRPQTPAQAGTVSERNHSSRLEQQQQQRAQWQQPQSAAVIDTAPRQRTELQVQPPQISRPSVPDAVFQPAARQMEQRIQQQAENHQLRSNNREQNVERAVNPYQPPVQVQTPRAERVERAATPAATPAAAPTAAPAPSSQSSESRKSDKDKNTH